METTELLHSMKTVPILTVHAVSIVNVKNQRNCVDVVQVQVMVMLLSWMMMIVMFAEQNLKMTLISFVLSDVLVDDQHPHLPLALDVVDNNDNDDVHLCHMTSGESMRRSEVGKKLSRLKLEHLLPRRQVVFLVARLMFLNGAPPVPYTNTRHHNR